MNPQTASINLPISKTRCLIIISGDPRNDETALEGLRCALGMSGDSRWEVIVGFCEKALGFVRDFTHHPPDPNVLSDPILKQWAQSPGPWHCFIGCGPEDFSKLFSLQERILDAGSWLQLGMAQSHIFFLVSVFEGCR